MSVALDVGAGSLRSLFPKGGGLAARQTRTAYCALPDTAGVRKYLATMKIPSAVCEDRLVVIGDAAAEASASFGVPLRRLLREGASTPAEPVERQILAALVESVVPEPRCPGEVCCLSLPKTTAERATDARQAEEFFSNIVRLRGYRPVSLSAPMGLVLAELGQEGFTGISLTLGASRSEICLAHSGREIHSETLAKGGDWLDEELARRSHDYAWDAQGNRYLDTQSAKQRREACSGTIVAPAGSDEQLLSDLYGELLTTLLRSAAPRLARAADSWKMSHPLTVVSSGGLTRINGFAEFVQAALRPPLFPLPVKLTRLADGDFTIARGLLIHAELESAATAVPAA